MDIDRHAAARLRISVLCCRRVEQHWLVSDKCDSVVSSDM